MPRHRRISPDGLVQHLVNRGDHRETLFHKPSDFRAFLAIVTEAAHRVPIRILAYCVMRNHFHLLVWPFAGKDVPDYMQTLMNIHIPRYLRHYPPVSRGHLYQGRYINSLIESGPSVLYVRRYVERNALAAGIVRRAEDYKWSSASRHANDPGRPTLDPGPTPCPPRWLSYLNADPKNGVDEQIHEAARRGAPYGSDAWVKTAVARYELQHTVRPRGRPAVYETIPW